MNIIFTLIIVLVAVGLTAGITYFLLKPQLQASEQINEDVRKQNEQMFQDQQELVKLNSFLRNENNILQIQKKDTENHIQSLNNSITTIEKQAQEAADLFYNTKMQVAKDSLERALEEESKNYQANVEHFKVEYDDAVKTLMEEFQSLSDNITILRTTNDAAVAAAKRAEEMKSQQDYYRIQLTAADLHEIELLRSVEPYLRDKEPLNKVIWKVYYEKPTTDLIGRVVGSGVHTGIYKITEIDTGKCYIGQAANIADRWKQHIKRGVGAETPTRNKLYPAMTAAGPQNFTFEIVEECDRASLDAREDYWQDYFKAKEFGYSIK